MVKNKWEKSLFILPVLYFAGWFRGSVSFVFHDYIYILPSILILLAITYLTVWMNRLHTLLSVSNVSDLYLNFLVVSKVRASSCLFLIALVIAELIPLIAYPFVYIIGVFLSVSVFSKYKRSDAVAIKDFLLREEGGYKNLTCYHFLNGELISEYASSVDNYTCSDEWNNDCVINPATGLPMIGGVDTDGNSYGSSSSQYRDY
ncbi:hypothetical protein [Yersinia hibernica]|uniref:Uncharacterized protein n=1 Tax=Yersinia enterocolitica LC20 TaxID=1443113 RepID=A0A7U4K381_YEREN|nr:hypothetical protein [Yersinia hibernica]AHM76623.1 hypothetical protein LC20_06051 [Yersinia hibernica]